MTHRSSKLVFLALVGLGGCSQIIGLSDYDIDPTLNAPGDGGDSAIGGKAGSSGKSGSSNNGGENPGTAGQPGEAGAGGAGAGGAGVGGDTGMAGETAVGGAGNLGELVDCDSTLCCTDAGGTAVGVELLQDGGFELGTVLEGETPWTESSSNDFEIISSDLSLGWKPHKGLYYAYLGGATLEDTGLFSENFLVPADAGWMVVSGFRYFQIDTDDEINDDWSAVALYNTMGTDNIEELPLFWGNAATSSIGFGDSAGYTKFEAEWSALPHRNKIRYVTIASSTDDYSTDVDTDSSSYLYDDVSLKVFRCYK